MATLKDHQQAMVDLLASGSGIPASASRLAHAMHDVLSAMLGNRKESFAEEMTRLCNERIEATTPGLNDKALAADVEACRPKQEIKESLLRAKERRVKELENTVRQLRASNAKLRAELDHSRTLFESGFKRCAPIELLPEQAGCHKSDTQTTAAKFDIIRKVIE
ncbi:hypothetical protein [Salmonella enterica]|uniref:hypothetical protein n=1 Tax=Salmonella enterica TaxID=28901 RepID=UPI00331581B7